MKFIKFGIKITFSFMMFSLIFSLFLSGTEVEDSLIILFILLLALRVFKKYTVSGEERVERKKISKKDIVVFYVLNYGLHVVSLLIVLVGTVFFEENFYTSNYIATIDLPLMIINSVLIGPIIEEIYFRKYIIDNFQKLGKKFYNYGIFLNSFLFGLAHLNLAGLGAFFVGISYSLVYLKTGNIMLPILLHSSRNLGLILAKINQLEIRILGGLIYIFFPLFLLLLYKNKNGVSSADK